MQVPFSLFACDAGLLVKRSIYTRAAANRGLFDYFSVTELQARAPTSQFLADSAHKGVNQGSKDITQTEQQRP